MRPPRGGLRSIHNKRLDVAKVELRVPAGGSLQVQDDVAAQLLDTGDFAEGPASAPLLDALDEGHFDRFPDDRPAPVRVVAEASRPPAKKAGSQK
jgi:hypothetical protein